MPMKNITFFQIDGQAQKKQLDVHVSYCCQIPASYKNLLALPALKWFTVCGQGLNVMMNELSSRLFSIVAIDWSDLAKTMMSEAACLAWDGYFSLVICQRMQKQQA